MLTVPTCNEISVEQNGKAIAVAQSYCVTTLAYKPSVITLSRVCPLPDSTIKDWNGFNIIIIKPDRKIIYSGCEWKSITRDGAIIESMEITCEKRIEIS